MDENTLEAQDCLADFFNRALDGALEGLFTTNEVVILVETLGDLACHGWSEAGLIEVEKELVRLFDGRGAASGRHVRAQEFIKWSTWKCGPFAKVFLRNAKERVLAWLDSDDSLSDVGYIRSAAFHVERIEVAMAALLAYYGGPLGLRRLDGEGGESSPLVSFSPPTTLRLVGGTSVATH
ncbi:MAG: hypothetical protein WC702_04315 [Patescibacteria group bacterium]|jgi:hypothetical protein